MSPLTPPSPFTKEDSELREGKRLMQGHTAGSFFIEKSLFGSGGSHCFEWMWGVGLKQRRITSREANVTSLKNVNLFFLRRHLLWTYCVLSRCSII